MNGVVVLLLKEIDLEGQNGEELVHVAAYLLDAILLPRPYLGGYVVAHRGGCTASLLSLLVQVLGNAEVEARVVNEYDHVGLPLADVALAHRHIPQDGPQVQQHRHEAHVGQFAVVLHQCAPLGCHQVAAKEAELGLRVFRFQGSHES